MDPQQRDHLRTLLRAGPVWGAEIDIRFRVLALTIEPSADVHPTPDAADRRLQVVLHPIGTVAASLREDTGEGSRILRFTEEQLPDVVATLDGPSTIGDPLPDERPDLDALGERLSMRGQAKTGDGDRHQLHLQLESGDLAFDLWARFDVVELRDPTGAELSLPD